MHSVPKLNLKMMGKIFKKCSSPLNYGECNTEKQTYSENPLLILNTDVLKLHLDCFYKAVLSSVTGGGVQFVVCDKWEQQQEDICGSLWGLRTSAKPQHDQRSGARAVPHWRAHEHIRLVQPGEHSLTSVAKRFLSCQTFVSSLHLQPKTKINAIVIHFHFMCLFFLILPGLIFLPVTEVPSFISSATTKTPASQDKR